MKPVKAVDEDRWLTCLYSRYLPCVAFASNSKRGLRSSPWLHGILFLVLFGMAYWVAASALAAASHNVLATCNGPLPHPPHPHPSHHHPEDPPAHDDEFHHHPHHPPGPLIDIWGPEGDKKGDRKILPGATLDLDLVKPEQPEARQLQANELSRPEPRPEDFQATPECRQAVGLYLGAWFAVIASFLVAVHYAARRRTMLRTKFGIAGSRMRDFCTWFWCPSCALCQETRTLWVNQVHDGVWNGPAKMGYAAVPTLPPNTNQAPASQFMTTGV
ncbi:hypothetical protein WJX73_005954 [Symbiochloris irregularis]|uniref:Uncharacterized protein n=1 Tax=Symbiochloris irregularis TaxID=706552 RepID=A0AAW1NKR0_9CHLO